MVGQDKYMNNTSYLINTKKTLNRKQGLQLFCVREDYLIRINGKRSIPKSTAFMQNMIRIHFYKYIAKILFISSIFL